jgi:uncharacterized phage-associated protein
MNQKKAKRLRREVYKIITNYSIEHLLQEIFSQNGIQLTTANQMSYPAIKIANYFIEKSNYTISPMKLIKLVYIAHGWHLALTNTALIDETVEAWQYGPVISSLYKNFKRYGNLEITELGNSISNNIPIDSNTEKLLEKVWEVYGKFTATQLANLTHAPKTPWFIAWHQNGGKKSHNHHIDNESIQAYYGNLAAQKKNT